MFLTASLKCNIVYLCLLDSKTDPFFLNYCYARLYHASQMSEMEVVEHRNIADTNSEFILINLSKCKA